LLPLTEPRPEEKPSTSIITDDTINSEDCEHHV